MRLLKITPLYLVLAAGGFAQTDPAAIERQQKDIERRESRELQKVDQAEEQERIKLRARERDELAKIQRDLATATGASTAAVVATGKMRAMDTGQLAQSKFDQDEVSNLIQNQLGAEITTRFNRDRRAVNRKYSLERAKFEAQQIEGEDAAKQRTLAVKTAELSAKYQEQLDNLDLEQEAETAKLRYQHTTKINAAERDITALTTKHLVEQMDKGAGAAAYLPMNDPDFIKLSTVRDAAKSALETALDELRAKFNVRRTDIDNAKEDEVAKLNG
jgi:hypothetical protein